MSLHAKLQKSRKKKGDSQSGGTESSAAESTANMLAKRSVSAKINYSALKSIFNIDYSALEPAGGDDTAEPTLSLAPTTQQTREHHIVSGNANTDFEEYNDDDDYYNDFDRGADGYQDGGGYDDDYGEDYDDYGGEEYG